MVARRFNREGKVILRLTIDTVGSLINVEILQDPGYGFAAAAVEAVRKSRFHPARHEGRPFTAKAILPIRFTLQGVN
jgi:protein TonB